jgi:hypothetical protein
VTGSGVSPAIFMSDFPHEACLKAVFTHGADTVTITNVTKAQLAAHTADLHLI